MVDLGHNCFRLGLEWARIEPAEGSFDEGAITQYVDMLRDLQSRGLKVCLTLNHWVLPQWLAEEGGWLSDRAIASWARFVDRVVPLVAPYVDLWVTLNEPMVPVLAGYLAGYHPPERRNPREAARVFGRLLEAHAIAYHRIHDLVPRAPDGTATMVGYAAAYQWVEPMHERGLRAAGERVLTRIVRQVSYKAWDDAVVTGRLPALFGRRRRILGLRGSVDWVGVNYYMRISVTLNPAALSNVTAGTYDAPPGIETTAMGWQVYPPGFRLTLVDAYRRLGVPIWITENGCSDPGDDLRRRYLISHIDQVGRAIEDGADIRGYFHWTLIDNFEWREGFEQRFGLITMDHEDPELVRRPKPSAEMFKRIAAENAVTSAIEEEFAPNSRARWLSR
jgi:beta-glucosidase